jgi:hypothetical protein
VPTSPPILPDPTIPMFIDSFCEVIWIAVSAF